jgi:hypothetical protein
MRAYLTLGDLVAPPPLSAVLALLLVLGFKYMGGRFCRLFWREERGVSETAACFIVAVALVAAGLQIMAVVWQIPLLLLRFIAWAIAALGLVELSRLLTRFFAVAHWKQLLPFFPDLRWWERAGFGISATTLGLLCLTALGPPTDADSLDYHLGVPLEFLRHGEAYARLDWFHARLIGSGEFLNMLGLAGGTDALGAALAAAGLVALAAVLSAIVRRGRDRVLVWGLLMGCPFLLFLVPNQKPFLLPVAATTIALVIIRERFQTFDGRSIFLAFGCAFFAMSCKYSFLLSGTVVLFAGLAAARGSRSLRVAIGLAVLFYALFLFPAHAQKMMFYGDPISPMLEQFRQQADPGLVRFASFLRHYSVSAFPFPVSIILPDSAGAVTSVLGMGSLALISALMSFRSSWLFAGAAVASTVILFLVGARSAGYYLEAYLWFSLAAAQGAWGRYKSLLSRVMLAQGTVILVLAVYGVATIFPGALTARLREGVMEQAAHQYAVMVWLQKVLPADTIMLSTLRSHVLMPRPFVAKDIVTWTDWGSLAETQKVCGLFKEARINSLIIEPFVSKEFADKLCMDIRGRIAGPEYFVTATRNPWNRGARFDLAVFSVDHAGKGVSQEPSAPKR